MIRIEVVSEQVNRECDARFMVVISRYGPEGYLPATWTVISSR